MPEETNTTTKKPINWKNILLGVTIGAVIFGTGGYLVYNAYQPKKEEPEQTTNIPKTATPSATPTDKDWQLVKGETTQDEDGKVYKFEFSAPKDFKVAAPRADLPKESQKYYYYAEGSGVTFFAGLMEGPGPLTVLHGRADQSNLCVKPLQLQETGEGYFEVCDVVKLGGKDALWLIDVHIGTNSHATACEKNATLHVIYNLGKSSSVYFTPELDVMKEIIKPWAKISSKPVGTVDSGGELQVCPKNIDYATVKSNLTSEINNIRTAKNLSAKDSQILDTLYKIIPTFKFLD
ncbi:MAG: hypothetical protein WD187_00570 [Candidatus Woykebacteria bacterium]